LEAFLEFGAEVLNIFFPNRCAICLDQTVSWSADPLCAECKDRMELNDGAACRVCGEPIDGASPQDFRLCGECRINPPPFDQTLFSLYYEENTKKLIRQFKFRGKAGLAGAIAALMSARLNRELDMETVDIVIPLPLHFLRLFKRGYNQSYLLAGRIAKTFGLPLGWDVLVKTKNSAPQSLLKKSERQKNIRKVFAVVRPETVSGKNVLLVDDLMTTGATLREAAGALKKAGARTVACSVAARA